MSNNFFIIRLDMFNKDIPRNVNYESPVFQHGDNTSVLMAKAALEKWKLEHERAGYKLTAQQRIRILGEVGEKK